MSKYIVTFYTSLNPTNSRKEITINAHSMSIHASGVLIFKNHNGDLEEAYGRDKWINAERIDE